MKKEKLFPIEIQENSVQSLWIRRHTKSKIIYWFILILLVLLAISLPFILIEISTQGIGIVRTTSENNRINSVLYAEVSRIDILENKQVLQGDTLVWLEVSELNEQIKRLEERIKENDMFLVDLVQLLNGKFAQTPKYIAEYSKFISENRELELARDHSKNEYNTSKYLFEKGVESKFDHEKVEANLNSLQSKLDIQYKQQYALWHAEKIRLELDNRDLESQMNQYNKKKKQYVIIAPISGTIVNYTGVRSSNFVGPGDVIAEIVERDTLIIECFISPKDIGYIHEEQSVKFQVDAFNYQQWGLLEGHIIEILPDVVEQNQQYFFRARCSVDRNYLELGNGYKGYLKKGMTVTGRFYLNERSIGQLLFDKVNDWINPKIITKNGN